MIGSGGELSHLALSGESLQCGHLFVSVNKHTAATRRGQPRLLVAVLGVILAARLRHAGNWRSTENTGFQFNDLERPANHQVPAAELFHDWTDA